MLSHCKVCSAALGNPIYSSATDVSITSLSKLQPGRTEVWFCRQCGHLQTQPLTDLGDYYRNDYNIMLGSEEEDQLYAVVDGKPVFRVQRQITTFLEKVSPQAGAHILDFGCAKGASAKQLSNVRPDIHVSVFDVSEVYRPFWSSLPASTNIATQQLPREWDNSFDAVMSFYVMEHVDEAVDALAAQVRMLKPSGRVYFLVPNVLANIADFIVSDHVHHYTELSSVALVKRVGLHVHEIDAASHESALIVVAGKEPSATAPKLFQSLETLSSKVSELADYWSTLGERVRDFEKHRSGTRAAIYGSGFYGASIASSLQDISCVECFVDRNPHRQGQSLLDIPVVAPADLDPAIHTMYVGLNPRIARSAIAGIPDWGNRPLNYFYL